jgi:hypothetical protein
LFYFPVFWCSIISSNPKKDLALVDDMFGHNYQNCRKLTQKKLPQNWKLCWNVTKFIFKNSRFPDNLTFKKKGNLWPNLAKLTYV